MMEGQSAFGMWLIFQSTPISCSVHKTEYFFYHKMKNFVNVLLLLQIHCNIFCYENFEAIDL